MNAYELANEIDACFTKADWNVLQASNMLRQQADRIAELEKQLEDAKDEMAEWKMSYENCHRMCNGYGMN